MQTIQMKMRTIRRVLVAAVPLAVSFCIPMPAARARTEMKITHRVRSLQPGEVVLLEAVSTEPLRTLEAQAFGRVFPAFGDRETLRWTALIGVDLDTKPGRYTAKVSGSDASGNRVQGEHVLVVTGKKFPTRQLTVDEKFVTPPREVQARIKAESEKVRAIFDTVTPERHWNGPFRVPVPGPVISEFGKRSVYNGQPRSPHSGVDFRGATGTLIRAPNAGKVVLAQELYYSGNTVILDHGQGLYSYFGHMSSISVKPGDSIPMGTLVGKVGATGLVTGPHLHWTVRLAGARVDPLSLVEILAVR